MKKYTIKEIFYTLQGEGFNAGKAAIFCRFSGCNLWNGQEKNSILKEVFKLSNKNICTTKEYKTLSFKNLKKGLELIKERKSFGKIIIKTKYYKEY